MTALPSSRLTWAVATVAAVLVSSVVAGVTFTDPAEARPARPDLVVSSGSVARSGTTIRVSLTVANRRSRQGARAPHSNAVVRAVRSGRTVILGRPAVGRVANGQKRSVKTTYSTSKLRPGTWKVSACADGPRRVRERKEHNNCRGLGSMVVPAPLCGTPNCAPLSLATDTEATYTDATGRYWAYVPSDLGAQPASVLIWLHGCGGDHGDVWGAADYWSEHFIAVLPDGAEKRCWKRSTGPDRVVDAVRSAIAHFNVDPKKIIIGGYSSGGDLAYRTAFLHSDLFAGLLAMNTSPFRDNGTSATVAQAAPSRFPVYHLAHDQDTTYPLPQVQSEIKALVGAGWTVDFQHVTGKHWSEPSAPGAPDGTWWDFQNRVVKDHMGLGWSR